MADSRGWSSLHALLKEQLLKIQRILSFAYLKFKNLMPNCGRWANRRQRTEDRQE